MWGRRKRLPIAVAVVAALVVFHCVFLLLLAGIVLIARLLNVLTMWVPMLGFVPALVLAGFFAESAYHRLRWRFVEGDAPFCATCDYNLTGNVSGVCPECGTACASTGQGP